MGSSGSQSQVIVINSNFIKSRAETLGGSAAAGARCFPPRLGCLAAQHCVMCIVECGLRTDNSCRSNMQTIVMGRSATCRPVLNRVNQLNVDLSTPTFVKITISWSNLQIRINIEPIGPRGTR